jgi:formate-dependent nitrite reductase membrane component NrfD
MTKGEGRGSRDAVSDSVRDGYYGRPVLKEPVWIWAVPAYLYVGGAAGAAVVLAEVAEALGPRGEQMPSRARWIGAAGAAIGTGLLIYDLGRPERFLNMLRVFRPTSPMSIGSWTLGLATPVFVSSALLSRGGSPRGRAGELAGKVAAALGLPLATYTAALLSTTAVPFWQEIRRDLPWLFAASAASSAAGLLQLTDLNRTEARVVGRLATLAQAGEVAAALVVERRAGRVARVGRPLHEGAAGTLWRLSQIATAASLGLGLVPVRARPKRLARGLLATGGGLALRFAVFLAGKASARDPRAVFELQRRGAQA